MTYDADRHIEDHEKLLEVLQFILNELEELKQFLVEELLEE